MPVFGLEHHMGDSTIWLGKIPRRDDRWRHHLSPPPQFLHGTKGSKEELLGLLPLRIIVRRMEKILQML
ncbi:hypothetical protein TNCV_4042511 [Trichonephila clavipes]|nr:hypothetical protein TNCV_4042511 [Trichonephila clavipes]